MAEFVGEHGRKLRRRKTMHERQADQQFGAHRAGQHETRALHDARTDVVGDADVIDRLDPEYKRLVDDICPSQISFSGLQAVLKLLLAERVSIRNLHLIIDKMDFPVLHHPFIQPVIKKRLVSAAFKRKRNQIPLDRQILPVADFFTNLYVQLDDSSQVRIIIVLDMAAMMVFG